MNRTLLGDLNARDRDSGMTMSEKRRRALNLAGATLGTTAVTAALIVGAVNSSPAPQPKPTVTGVNEVQPPQVWQQEERARQLEEFEQQHDGIQPQPGPADLPKP